MINPVNSNDRAGWEQIWRSGNIPPRYRSFATANPTVAEWAETITPGGFVLDLGCGVGRHAIYLGERGFRMAGVDISPTGVRLAQAACMERQIVFDGKVSDMTMLPWADMTFDAVLSTSTIHHHRRAGIVQALAEVRRLLKPAGLFLADFPCTDTLIYQQLCKQVAVGEIVEVEPNTFVDERPNTEDDDGFLPHHFCDEADLRDLFQAFKILKLWADVHEITSASGSGLVGKWVVWARRPFMG